MKLSWLFLFLACAPMSADLLLGVWSPSWLYYIALSWTPIGAIIYLASVVYENT